MGNSDASAGSDTAGGGKVPRRSWWPILAALVGALLLPLRTFAAADPAPPAEKSMEYQGAIRTWLEHVPRSYTGRRPVPLVVALHSFYSSAAEFAPRSEWMPKSDQAGFIVVFPNGGQDFHNGVFGWNSWVYDGSAPDDVGFLLALIQQLERDYRVDPARIYMTGFSNGGGMTNTFAGVHAAVLAAIAPGSSGWMTSFDVPVEHMKPGAPLPVWIFRGEKEDLVNGKLPLAEQDRQAIAFWVGFDGDAATPHSATRGIYRTDTYTGGRAEVRFTTVAGYVHQYGPGFADRIWDDFFARQARKAVK